MLRNDGVLSALETTDSAAALYGSDSNDLSDLEALMDTSTPRGESSMPCISGLEGIGSWTESILDSRDYLPIHSQLLVPQSSREAKAVIRGINRAVAAVNLLDDAEEEQPLFISSWLGLTLDRRQLLDNNSDADSFSQVEQRLNPCHASRVSTEGDGGPVVQTWKEGVVIIEGDLERQRHPDRSMNILLNHNNRFLPFAMLLSAAGLSMTLSYWFWTY